LAEVAAALSIRKWILSGRPELESILFREHEDKMQAARMAISSRVS
jgi:hypothetical protein